MVRFQFFIIHCLTGKHIDFIHIKNLFFHQHVHKMQEHLCRCLRIVYCTVVSFQTDAKIVTDNIQLVFFQLWQQRPRKPQRIQHSIFHLCTTAQLCVMADKSHVKAGIMCYHHCVTAECQKFRQKRFNLRRICNHFVRNACQGCNLSRNRTFRIYKTAESFHDFTVFYFDRTNFRNPLCFP